MKFRSLISALIVFTLVMTCAMSAVSAAKFTTTTNYSASGVTVTTNVTGFTGSPMISYVIYDKNYPAPSESNIKYIDQKTVSDGTTSFTVTDTVAKLDGNKILLGSSGEAVTPEVSGNNDRVDNIDDYSDLLVTYDGLVDKTDNSVTFLVHQNKSGVKTGINVVARVGDEEYVFNGLMNLSDDTYYAIKLVDERTENAIDFEECEFDVTPVVGETEMTNVSGSNYWIETAGN